MIARLLRYLHQAVFDTSADEQSAIRIESKRTIKFEIQANKLKITLIRGWGQAWGAFWGTGHFDSQSPTITIDLGLYTLSELVDFINSCGLGAGWGYNWGGAWGANEIRASLSDSSMANLSATILMDKPTEVVTEGVTLSAFTSLIWVIMSAYAKELIIASEAVVEAIKQMFIPTSSGYWLTTWGEIFGLVKRNDETDPEFVDRFIPEIFRKRLNARAIEKAILDATGDVVRILEPWEDLFQLDYSRVSGSDRMYDGDTVGYHIIAPQSVGSVNWDKILPIIERNRAAGVMVLPPESLHTSYTVAPAYHLYAGHTVVVGSITMIPGARSWQPVPWTGYPWNAIAYIVTSSHQSVS